MPRLMRCTADIRTSLDLLQPVQAQIRCECLFYLIWAC